MQAFNSGRGQWRLGAAAGLLLVMGAAQAEVAPPVRAEITGLLDFVEHSGCQFVRNGTAYPAPQAREHLQKKLTYLEGKKRINSAEDFIELAATQSSMSGKPYQVRCPTGSQPAGTWLNTELHRQRAQ